MLFNARFSDRSSGRDENQPVHFIHARRRRSNDSPTLSESRFCSSRGSCSFCRDRECCAAAADFTST
jgi:hypothetical protein